VNSFGFGGTNCHVVLDDSFHSLETIAARQAIRSSVNFGEGYVAPATLSNGHHESEKPSHKEKHRHGIPSAHSNGISNLDIDLEQPRVLVWSAADEEALIRMHTDYTHFFAKEIRQDNETLRRLAVTLSSRRSRMTWRSFAILDNHTQLQDLLPRILTPVRSVDSPRVAFIFTGQGAQYAEMGLTLLRFPVFKSILRKIESVFHELGSRWNIISKVPPHQGR
jgi:acyl transferase domain-containing protein